MRGYVQPAGLRTWEFLDISPAHARVPSIAASCRWIPLPERPPPAGKPPFVSPRPQADARTISHLLIQVDGSR